jgi:two-component system, NarL family, response regulator NreC
MITIVLVDDHPIIREGLKNLLDPDGRFQVVGEAGSGVEALQLVDQLKPDILLLDWVMPGMSGLAVLMQVRVISPKTRVIIISMHGNEAYVLQAIRNGAYGYILKDSEPGEVLQAVSQVAEGRHFLSSPLSEVLINSYIHKTEATELDPYDTLTLREREVFNYLAEGLTNSEIASNLSISSRTVEAHRSKVMHKLGLHSHNDVIRFALKKGLISMDE